MNQKEVEKIYNLSNLSLEGKDIDVLTYKFNKVLDFVEDIFDIDTDGVDMTEEIFNHKAIFRNDEVEGSIKREEALKNAKDTEFGYFRLDWKL